MNPFLFVWIALLFAVFWFMILRPRREAARRSLEVSRSLDVGEEVITIGGLYGTIVSIDDREVELEVSDGVTLRFARRAIAGKAPVDEPEDDELEDELEDDELEDEEDDADDELVVDAELEDDDLDSREKPVIEPARNADESSGR
jgi:preprotein translocase subunit YajC